MSSQDPASLYQDFRRWIADPARTNDELCPVELLLNWARVVWGWKHKKPAATDWAKTQAAKKERLNNPAYRPRIDPEKLEMAGEIWGEIVKWPVSNYEDRPVRSLAVLRFLPHLEELEIDSTEIADLKPIAGLSKLRKLKLGEPPNGGHITRDLAPLAGLATLEVLTLNLRAPWPDLAPLAKLPALRKLDFYGNVLALCGIPQLAALRTGNLRGDHRWNVPVRDLGELPRMPSLERFAMKGVADLKGAERLGPVRNLDLEGPFAELGALTALEQITSLRLEGERFMDLSPLVRLPNLRELILVRERPLDLAPLSDSSSLREVSVERCPILQTELAALNAALLSWDEDFFAPEPRTLLPLRILRVESQHPDVVKALALPRPPDPREEVYHDDRAISAAEGRWFARHLQTRLDALLGKGWGNISASGIMSAGHQHLDIKRFRDVTRLGEIIQVIREMMARCRFPWEVLLSVEPHGDLTEEMEEIRARDAAGEKPWWEKEFDPAEEREEYEEFRRNRRELYERFEREHRLRLLEQQGARIDPEDFSPASESKAKTKGGKPADEDDFEDEELENDEGDSELAEELSFIVMLEENVLWVPRHMQSKAEYALGREAQAWHELPEPIEKRPRPHP